MLGGISPADLWGAAGTIAVSILGGGLAMSWRLGRLEGKVETTLVDHSRRLDDLEEARWRPATRR